MLEFKEASRRDVRIKMALGGKSGAGKTLSALLIAKGLVENVAKVGVLQTEAGRAQCYLRDIGTFKVLDMAPPFSPMKYIEGIEIAEKSKLEVLVIDSISDEWAGPGGALDMHSAACEVTKNTFTAWKNVTPKHDQFMNRILQSPLHIICTVRKKTETILETVERNGRTIQVPKRVGLKDIQRDDSEYRWIVQFDLEQEGNLATVIKDNTKLFQGKPAFLINVETGKKLRDWCLT